MSFLLRQISQTGDGREIVRTHVVERDTLTIGRAPANDIVLADLSVSLDHARIARIDEWQVSVVAHGTLGFSVDGRKALRATIDSATGGEIAIGAYRITVSREPDGQLAVTVMQVGAAVERDEARAFSLRGLLPGKRATAWVLVVAILVGFLAVPIWGLLPPRGPAQHLRAAQRSELDERSAQRCAPRAGGQMRGVPPASLRVRAQRRVCRLSQGRARSRTGGPDCRCAGCAGGRQALPSGSRARVREAGAGCVRRLPHRASRCRTNAADPAGLLRGVSCDAANAAGRHEDRQCRRLRHIPPAIPPAGGEGGGGDAAIGTRVARCRPGRCERAEIPAQAPSRNARRGRPDGADAEGQQRLRRLARLCRLPHAERRRHALRARVDGAQLPDVPQPRVRPDRRDGANAAALATPRR